MKAISIKQPWASLIVEGVKDIENRTWKCPEKYIGQRVLIHASKTCDKHNWNALNERQKKCLRGTELYHLSTIELPYSAIIGSVEIVNCVINYPSIWAEESYYIPCYDRYDDDDPSKIIYNWVLANPIKFPQPIPAKGKLSFWDYPNINAEPEEKGGREYCHCQIPVKEEIQVLRGHNEYYCNYCGGLWYK